jgi:hypothetical protein
LLLLTRKKDNSISYCYKESLCSLFFSNLRRQLLFRGSQGLRDLVQQHPAGRGPQLGRDLRPFPRKAGGRRFNHSHRGSNLARKNASLADIIKYFG